MNPEHQIAHNETPIDNNEDQVIKPTEAELDAKFLVTNEKPSLTPESFSGVSDPSEFIALLKRANNTITDPISGVTELRPSIIQDLERLSLDLGQAAGLIRNNGTYEGSPRRIVDEVFAAIGNLPRVVQAPFRNTATRYIETILQK